MTQRSHYGPAICATCVLWATAFVVTNNIRWRVAPTPSALQGWTASLAVGGFVAAWILKRWLARVQLASALFAIPVHCVLVLASALVPVHFSSVMVGVLDPSGATVERGLANDLDEYVASARIIVSGPTIFIALALSAISVAILWLGARREPGAAQGETRLQS